MPKVPVQKGEIKPLNTSKNMPYNEKVIERKKEVEMLQDNQTLKLKMPKNGK